MKSKLGFYLSSDGVAWRQTPLLLLLHLYFFLLPFQSHTPLLSYILYKSHSIYSLTEVIAQHCETDDESLRKFQIITHLESSGYISQLLVINWVFTMSHKHMVFTYSNILYNTRFYVFLIVIIEIIVTTLFIIGEVAPASVGA